MQFAEFKDRLKWLQLLETDRPLNLGSKQRAVINQISDPVVNAYVGFAFHNGEHMLA